ncbi:unnamed protein product, partial [Closterium sp. NIES-54]
SAMVVENSIFSSANLFKPKIHHEGYELGTVFDDSLHSPSSNPAKDGVNIARKTLITKWGLPWASGNPDAKRMDLDTGGGLVHQHNDFQGSEGGTRPVDSPIFMTPTFLADAGSIRVLQSPSSLASAGRAGMVDGEIQRLIRDKRLEDPFYVMDIGEIVRLFTGWTNAFPRVHPFYAVKCNPSPVLLSVLAALGAGFDCASKAEISQVLSMGVSPDSIIFANPCKMPSHITYASRVGVRATTFDSESELFKLHALNPSAVVLLRLQANDSTARCNLGVKYGALMQEVPSLLAVAARLKLHVAGVSFHVGSGAADPTAFTRAIAAARDVFDMAADVARAAGTPAMSVLDVGGGFTAPGTGCSGGMAFDAAANAINSALDRFFPEASGVTVIAEPGRYFAETPSTLATCVFGRRVRGERREYWINDGLYGSMNCALYDHATVRAHPLARASVAPDGFSANGGFYGGNYEVIDVSGGGGGVERAEDGEGLPPEAECGGKRRKGGGGAGALRGASGASFPSTVFGPTCDGLDMVLRDEALPELAIGDWLVFPNMGAYTAAAGSSFNGFATGEIKTYLVYTVEGEEEHGGKAGLAAAGMNGGSGSGSGTFEGMSMCEMLGGDGNGMGEAGGSPGMCLARSASEEMLHTPRSSGGGSSDRGSLGGVCDAAGSESI